LNGFPVFGCDLHYFPGFISFFAYLTACQSERGATLLRNQSNLCFKRRAMVRLSVLVCCG